LSKFVTHFHYWEITDEIWWSFIRRLRADRSNWLSLSRYAATHGMFDSVIVPRFPPVLSVIRDVSRVESYLFVMPAARQKSAICPDVETLDHPGINRNPMTAPQNSQ
jgi:hypothetical protein